MPLEWTNCSSMDCELDNCHAEQAGYEFDITYDWIGGDDDPTPYTLTVWDYKANDGFGEEALEVFLASADECREAAEIFMGGVCD